MKKIGILCSGGDSQGMNTAIKVVANMCSFYGIEVIGIRRGYQGLIENDINPLDNEEVFNIANLGGCYLNVARSKEFMTEEGITKAINNLKQNKIECLIVVGGNGSYKGAMELMKRGVKVIGLPGTIDNDLFYTERTLGFDTAVNAAVSAIDNIRQTMEANNRVAVFEVMGRECGDIALNVGVAVQAHSVAVKELNTTIDDIVADVKKMLESKITASPIVVISEALDYGVKEVEEALAKQLNVETRSTVIGYLQRGGAPSVEDRTFATQMGILSVELINNNISNVALGISNNRVFAVDIEKAVNAKRDFNLEMYNDLRKLYRLKAIK